MLLLQTGYLQSFSQRKLKTKGWTHLVFVLSNYEPKVWIDTIDTIDMVGEMSTDQHRGQVGHLAPDCAPTVSQKFNPKLSL